MVLDHRDGLLCFNLNVLWLVQARSDKTSPQYLYAKHEVRVISVTKNPYINFLSDTHVIQILNTFLLR